MTTKINFNQLGQADFGWLQAKHHFSFGHYYNPKRMGFGVIRVINDDTIQAGTGFDTHPHDNMEIITYVRSGAITHKDDQGNEGRTEAGDVQVMSAGAGIRHSEYNLENQATTLYQIWIEPNKRGVKPRWDAHKFPKQLVSDKLNLLVSGDGQAPLFIHQDATIHAGRLSANTHLNHPIKHQAYVLVSEGEIEINGELAKQGDAVEVTDLNSITLRAVSEAEVLVIDAPARNHLSN